MHLEAEHIQRLLHHELGPLDEAVAEHLAECEQCRRAVEEARQEEARIFDLFRRLDHAPPSVGAESLVKPNRGVVWGRRAAGIVLALGIAGAAYAATGSPLPRWVNSVVERIAGGSPPPKEPEVVPEPSAVAGIAVTPGERFTIAFAELQSRGTGIVSLTDGRDVAVRAKNGAATFTSAADRLSVNNRGSTADYEIELPRGPGRIEVVVGSRRLLLKEKGRVTGAAPVDSLGRYRLDLTPSSYRRR